MKNVSCLIFDLDGTLLDTLQDLAISVNYALSYHSLPSHSIDEIRMMVGNGVEKLIRRAVPEDKSDITIQNVLTKFKQHYLEHSEDNTKPYTGIIEMLTELKANGYLCAVVSNKFDDATKHLCQKYFPDLIDIAVGENEAEGIRKKPSPDMVDRVIEELNINRSQCVYIGDSDVDIMTASNSGIPCISVLWGFRTKDFLLKHGASSFAITPQDIFKHVSCV